MPDGTVQGTDKIQRNGNTYTLTGDINLGILPYMALMLIGTALLALPPLVFMKMKKPSWKPAAPLAEESAPASADPGALPAEQKEA